MSKFGGGGTKCVICDKTAYPAETIQFEKKCYHYDCFRCVEDKCSRKKLENCNNANLYDDKLYCKQCFAAGGYSQKQKNTKWVKKEGGSAAPSKFGGGGTACTICEKTVYMAETVMYEKQAYHDACFKCSDCDVKIRNVSGAQLFDGKLKCSKCWDAKGYARMQTKVTQGATTSGAADPKFANLGGGAVSCHKCEDALYSAEAISYNGVNYHGKCFNCEWEGCDKKLSTSNCEGNAKEKTVYCKGCWSANGLGRA